MDHLTIVMAYFNQPQIMQEWWRVLRQYGDLAAKVSLRIVDDCSKEHPLTLPQDILDTFDVKAFRATTDREWNEMGCRNLAMKHTKGWAFMTDPDYILLPSEVKKLMGTPNLAQGRRKMVESLKPGCFYHLRSRSAHTGKELHRPENMAVVHSSDFWKAGGYDETFAGGYGFSDCLFFKCLREVAGAKDIFVTDVWMDHYTKGTIPSVHGGKNQIMDAASPAKRDTRRNQPKFEAIVKRMRREGSTRYAKNLKPLQFRWIQIH